MVVGEAHPQDAEDRIQLPADEKHQRRDEKDPAGAVADNCASTPRGEARAETEGRGGGHDLSVSRQHGFCRARDVLRQTS